jgi:hypothetical protein
MQKMHFVHQAALNTTHVILRMRAQDELLQVSQLD